MRLWLAFLFTFGLLKAQTMTFDELLKSMKAKYDGQWCTSYTAKQENKIHTVNNSDSNAVSYKTVQFPLFRRLDYGSPSEGNATIYRKDSVYEYRKGKLTEAYKAIDDELLLNGGMYFMSADSVKYKLGVANYNIGLIKENPKSYTIGDPNGNRFIITKEDLSLSLIVKQRKEGKTKIKRMLSYDMQKPYCKGFIEQKVTVKINDLPFQKEEIVDIKTNIKLNPLIFEPKQFGKYHWLD